jgi:hypothetical protein
VAKPFDSAVVQVDVCHVNVGPEGVRVYGKAVVLGRDLNFSRREVFNWLIASAMPELEFVGIGAKSAPHDLVTKADAEYRESSFFAFLHEPLNCCDAIGYGLRITRTV